MTGSSQGEGHTNLLWPGFVRNRETWLMRYPTGMRGGRPSVTAGQTDGTSLGTGLGSERTRRGMRSPRKTSFNECLKRHPLRGVCMSPVISLSQAPDRWALTAGFKIFHSLPAMVNSSAHFMFLFYVVGNWMLAQNNRKVDVVFKYRYRQCPRYMQYKLFPS